MRHLSHKFSRRARAAVSCVVLGLVVAVCPLVAPQAQRAGKESGVNVTGVTARTNGADAVVSISADAPLNRAQTWQDSEGFHVVVYKGRGNLGGVPRGVKVRRVGESLEFVVPVKPGGGVYVQPRFNNLDLVVSGGLHATTDSPARGNSPAQTSRATRSDIVVSKLRANAANGLSTGGHAGDSIVSVKNEKAKLNLTPLLAPPAALKFTATPNMTAQHAEALVAAASQTKNGVATPSPVAENVPANEQAAEQTQAAEPVAMVPSGNPEQNATRAAKRKKTSLPDGGSSFNQALIVLGVCFSTGLAAFMFIFLRARRKTATSGSAEGESHKTTEASDAIAEFDGEARFREQRKGERRTSGRTGGRRADDKQALVATDAPSMATTQSLEKLERKPLTPAHVPAVIFGAYQIDQEVEKLVAGQTHSIEVLASRATDDRRAIEASLLKALNANSLGASEHERARYALEEYGFVARHSAAVLLAPDAYERSSAARALGEMRSRASLPFLLEALYDGEQIVCTEAVKSLGSLGLPSAIGALLDMARRHPEVPPALLGRALSACSVDCINLAAGANGDTFALTEPTVDPFTGEIRGFEPVAAVEQLPEWMEDETLADALERLDSADVEARVAAAQQLAQFQVQRSVEALTSLAGRDRDAAVRAAAVTSLGNIGHETVFSSVLIAMADDAREVRAAAARALSRLNFDRADAYVRVSETVDAETLGQLASACVGAGLANQALSRLASDDRRQAYEAFSLLSLVAKGGQAALILKVVEEHKDLNVRLAASRLLGLMGDAELDASLRRIALGANAPEKLRTAILEAIYRGEAQSVAGGVIEANSGESVETN